MQYTKSMIDLVFQIRKIAPNALRPQIKLTNPALLTILVDVYASLDSTELKGAELQLLIYELLTLAGPEWAQSIAMPEISVPKNPAATKHTEARSPTPPATKEKIITYRGQRSVVPA